MTRQRKTPRQRAEEALAIANRRVKSLAAHKAKLTKELADVTADHDQALVRRDYLANNPDLPQTPSTTSNPTGDNPA